MSDKPVCACRTVERWRRAGGANGFDGCTSRGGWVGQFGIRSTLVLSSASDAQVGGTTVRLGFSNDEGTCVLGGASTAEGALASGTSATGGATTLDVWFAPRAMFSTSAEMRCDAVATSATRLRAFELASFGGGGRAGSVDGARSVNNFTEYVSEGFEVYAVPDAPTGLAANSLAWLGSAAQLNFTAPDDNNDQISLYEVRWKNVRAVYANDTGMQLFEGVPPSATSLLVVNLTNAQTYSLTVRAYNLAGWGALSDAFEVDIEPGRFGVGSLVSSFSRADAGARATITLLFTTTHTIAARGGLAVELPDAFPNTTQSASTPRGTLTVDSVPLVGSVALTSEPSSAPGGLDRRRSGVVLTFNFESLLSGVPIEAYSTIKVALSGIELPRATGRTGRLPRVATLSPPGDVLGGAPVNEASLDYHSDDRADGLLVTPGVPGSRMVASLGSLVAGAETTLTLTLNLSNPIPPEGFIVVRLPSAFANVSDASAVWSVASASYDAEAFGTLAVVDPATLYAEPTRAATEDLVEPAGERRTLVLQRPGQAAGALDIGDASGTGLLEVRSPLNWPDYPSTPPPPPPRSNQPVSSVFQAPALAHHQSAVVRPHWRPPARSHARLEPDNHRRSLGRMVAIATRTRL